MGDAGRVASLRRDASGLADGFTVVLAVVSAVDRGPRRSNVGAERERRSGSTLGTSFVPRDPFEFKGVTEELSDFGRLDDQESGRGKDSVGAVRFERVAGERFAPDMSILGRLGDE